MILAKLIWVPVLFLVTQVGADVDPYRQFHMTNLPGASCCGGNDCKALPDEQVHRRRDGFDVAGWGFVPMAESQPGFDNRYHLCEYPKGTRRCFIYPGPGA